MAHTTQRDELNHKEKVMVNQCIKNEKWTETRPKPELILFLELAKTNLSIISGMLIQAFLPIAGLFRTNSVPDCVDYVEPLPTRCTDASGSRWTQEWNVLTAGTQDTQLLAFLAASDYLTAEHGAGVSAGDLKPSASIVAESGRAFCCITYSLIGVKT